MMPLSLSLRNISEEPFFSGGVASLYLLMSSNVRMRRLSRAKCEKPNTISMSAFFNLEFILSGLN